MDEFDGDVEELVPSACHAEESNWHWKNNKSIDINAKRRARELNQLFKIERYNASVYVLAAQIKLRLLKR
ncbi:hypothetical protein CHS0354_036531, partial [Potamilus streckersoni]